MYIGALDGCMCIEGIGWVHMGGGGGGGALDGCTWGALDGCTWGHWMGVHRGGIGWVYVGALDGCT